MKTQIKQILNILQESSSRLTVGDIADKTGYSVRYVRRLLEEMEIEGPHKGYQIRQIFRKGIVLTISDQELFNQALNTSSQGIASELLVYLIETNDYVRRDDLMDVFYLSRTTLNRVLEEVRTLAAEYDIEIIWKSKAGLKASGSEMNMRKCTKHLHSPEPGSDQQKTVRRILRGILSEYDYEISDFSFDNLTAHILITLDRIRSGKSMNENLELKNEYPLQEKIAESLIRELSSSFCLDVPVSEKNYFVIHLLSKQMLEKSNEITQETIDLCSAILLEIRDELSFDLTGDLDLELSLCQHLQPMLFRLRYGFQQENPLLENIKRECLIGYEYATIAKKVIFEKTGLKTNDDELGYLATHFELAVRRSKENRKLKILLVCASGRGTAKILQYQFMEKYHLSADDVNVASAAALDHMDLASYSCMISTVPLHMELPIPALYVKASLDLTNNEQVRQFVEGIRSRVSDAFYTDYEVITDELSSRDEVLQAIAEKAAHYYDDSIDLYGLLRERERLSSTEVGNGCALPHPKEINAKTSFVLAMVLKKPVRWEEMKVSLVVLQGIGADEQNLEERISQIIRLISAPNSVRRLLQNPDRETLITLLEEQS